MGKLIRKPGVWCVRVGRLTVVLSTRKDVSAAGALSMVYRELSSDRRYLLNVWREPVRP